MTDPQGTSHHLKVTRVGEPEWLRGADGHATYVLCHVDPPGDAALLDGVDRVDVRVDGVIWSCDLWVAGFDAVTGAVSLELSLDAPPVGAELVAFRPEAP